MPVSEWHRLPAGCQWVVEPTSDNHVVQHWSLIGGELIYGAASALSMLHNN